MKKLISILLVLCLIFSLAACGGEKTEEPSGEVGTQIGEQTPSTPNDTPSTPDETPSTPDETPSTPDQTPSTPNQTPSTPDQTPSTPDQTPSTPDQTPSTPDQTPSTPDQTPSTPSEPETPSNQFVAVATPENPTTLGMFYRNVIGAKIVSTDKAVLEVNKKADAMLKKIEDYPDNVKVSGKTYYVSNSGSDDNNGTSPKTPKATYEGVRGKLKAGDAVLFNRGDVFRGQVKMVSGVTYGAYGEGIKPRFYGSISGTEGEWRESEPGIYVYNKSMNYGNIIFDNGVAIGRPVQRKSDITKRKYNVFFNGSRLFVYSPDGNPKDLFKEIEIVEDYTLFTSGGGGTKNVKLQNLCLMFTGVHFLGSLGITKNLTVEGCIMGYCGGKDLWRGSSSVSLGNSIEFWSQAVDIFIHDNYFFQAFDAALTHQGPSSTVSANNAQSWTNDFTNIHYENNLCEYNTYDFEAFTCRSLELQSKSPKGKFTYNDVYIKGNIARFTGWGWGSLDRPDKNVYNTFKYDAEGDQDANGNYTNIHVKPLYIENNIFDRSRGGVLGISSPASNKKNMILKNNQFVQDKHAKIFGGLKLGDDYMSLINERFTASGNKFTLVK